MSTDRPRLAITIGDAAGIGPEIALRVFADERVNRCCRPLLVGSYGLIDRCAQHLGLPTPSTKSISDAGSLNVENLCPGRFSAETGRASYEAVCHAIDLAVAGDVAAIVTGPIQKEAWAAAGITYPGHTELLADRAGHGVDGNRSDVRMMLASDSIACVLETIHVPLADVATQLDTVSLTRTICLAAETIGRRKRRRGDASPVRVGVCGLNPHAGENGLFGHGEEEAIIQPAIEVARARSLSIETSSQEALPFEVIGPLPPDTAFTPSWREQIDVYVCMYHDQGLIPLKALSFEDAVNVTLGLPVVRTSVDHGTAMDLAWQGKALTTSMIAAIELASELCLERPLSRERSQ